MTKAKIRIMTTAIILTLTSLFLTLEFLTQAAIQKNIYYIVFNYICEEVMITYAYSSSIK